MPGMPWPPPSPYVWKQQWFSPQGEVFWIEMSFRYNDTDPRALLGMDYILDAGCPWDTVQVTKPDGAIIQRTIPRGARTGTVTKNQLNNLPRVAGSPGTDGLVTFADLGSITVFKS